MSTQVGESAWANTWREVEDRIRTDAATMWAVAGTPNFGSLHAPKPGTTRIITGNIGARTLCGLRSWPVVLPDTAEQAGTYRCPVCSDLAGLTPVGGGARVGSPNRVPR